MATICETERLVLRPFTLEDAERLCELDSDPEVLRYIGPYGHSSPEPYRERIATVYRDYDDRFRALGYWAAIERGSGAFLGWVCLRPALDYRFAAEAQFTADDAELGYRLRRSAWGKGYATEASRRIVARGFEEESIACVVSSALRDNRASWRVMEKVGLRFVREFEIPGYACPAVKYALSRSEWRRAAAPTS